MNQKMPRGNPIWHPVNSYCQLFPCAAIWRAVMPSSVSGVATSTSEWEGGAQSSGLVSIVVSTGIKRGRGGVAEEGRGEEGEKREVGGVEEEEKAGFGDGMAGEGMSSGMLIGGPLHACVEADSSHSDTKGEEVTGRWERIYGATFFSNDDGDDDGSDVIDDECDKDTDDDVTRDDCDIDVVDDVDVNAELDGDDNDDHISVSKLTCWEPWQQVTLVVESEEDETVMLDRFFFNNSLQSEFLSIDSPLATDGDVTSESHEERSAGPGGGEWWGIGAGFSTRSEWSETNKILISVLFMLSKISSFTSHKIFLRS